MAVKGWHSYLPNLTPKPIGCKRPSSSLRACAGQEAISFLVFLIEDRHHQLRLPVQIWRADSKVKLFADEFDLACFRIVIQS
jgi:hypothetical protein